MWETLLPGHVSGDAAQPAAAAERQTGRLGKDGDFVQYPVRRARMSEHQAEEAVVAAHAVGHDRVRGRHRVLLSHHGR